MVNNVVLMFSPTNEKTPTISCYSLGQRESYSSVGSRGINSLQIPQTALHGPGLREY